MLSTYFSPSSNYLIIPNITLPLPLYTRKSHTLVPETHLSLSNIKIVGKMAPKALHIYAHPCADLEMDDLFRYLGQVRECSWSGEGLFRVATLGTKIAFCQIGGVPVGLFAPGARN
jgi:hypothetical protein